MFHIPRVCVVGGCVSSGKSKTLIARIEPLDHSSHRLQVFTHALDPEQDVHCRNGGRLPAIVVESSVELFERVEPKTSVVAIDEAQFFDMNLVHVVNRLATSGRTVYIAGLDLDWQGNTFGPMGDLFAIAEHVEKLHAWCTWPECDRTATRSQRLVDITKQVDAGQKKFAARCNGLGHWDPTRIG